MGLSQLLFPAPLRDGFVLHVKIGTLQVRKFASIMSKFGGLQHLHSNVFPLTLTGVICLIKYIIKIHKLKVEMLTHKNKFRYDIGLMC